MILMRVELDNFLGFSGFKLSMSYPKAVVSSCISGEHLMGNANFRYKKAVILMGSNATGKTSLGQMLNHIFNFMMRRQTDSLLKSVCNKSCPARFRIDFAIDKEKPELYILEGLLESVSSREGCEVEILVRLRKTIIRKGESYERTSKRLEQQEAEYEDYVEVLRGLPQFGFLFSYPMDVLPNTVPKGNSEVYREVLEKVLKVLDSAILKVDIVPDAKNSYNIHMQNGQNVLIQEGQVVDTALLSSGTKAGIGIADILTAMKEHSCGFYYCDERFSYIQSEIECAILSVMLELLGENEQLFFTTHNTEILKMPLPKHSYTFMKKRITEVGAEVECINASDYLKRNTDSLRKAYENDIFSISPATEMLYEIKDK